MKNKNRIYFVSRVTQNSKTEDYLRYEKAAKLLHLAAFSQRMYDNKGAVKLDFFLLAY